MERRRLLSTRSAEIVRPSSLESMLSAPPSSPISPGSPSSARTVKSPAAIERATSRIWRMGRARRKARKKTMGIISTATPKMENISALDRLFMPATTSFMDWAMNTAP